MTAARWGVGAALLGVLLIPAGGAALKGGVPADRPGVHVASGSTPGGDWKLFARRSGEHRLCTMLEVRSRRGYNVRGGACGWRRPIGNVTIGDRRGAYAHGPLVRGIASVRVLWRDGRRQTAELYGSPPGLRFGGRFWIASRDSMCTVASVRALDRQGRTVKLVRLPEPTGVEPGEPDPFPCPEEKPAVSGCRQTGAGPGADPVEGRDIEVGRWR